MEVTQEIPLLKAAIFNHQEATAGVGFLGGRSTAKKIGMRSASRRHHRRAQVAVAVAIVPQRLLIWIWIVSHRHSGDSKAADFSKKTRGSNSPFRRTLTLCVCVCFKNPDLAARDDLLRARVRKHKKRRGKQERERTHQSQREKENKHIHENVSIHSTVRKSVFKP